MLIAGCSPDGTEAEKEQGSQLKIYTSIYPLQYFVERIGGEHVDVQSIIPPGADGHTYEPTTKELIKIAESDMLIYNGAGFEGFIDKAKKSLDQQDVVFVMASEQIHSEKEGEDAHHDEEDSEGEDAHHDEEDHEGEEHNHEGEDPHFWLDPVQAIQMADTIKHEIIELRPEWKDEFEANFGSLKSDLQELDGQFEKVAKEAERKEFIVAHSAYGKWEERYGLKQISISGLSPSHEPTQKEAQKIIDYAREHDVRYIIFEKNYTSNVAEMIRKEVDAEVLYLSNLESLTEEQLDAGEDYMSIMEENIRTLKKALN